MCDILNKVCWRKKKMNKNEHENHSHDCSCGCGHHHNNDEIITKKTKYKDFEFDDNTDDSCDLDPSKICDNCGKCLDIYNTDKDGFVQIQIDRIEKGDSSLQDLYKMYGLDGD